MNKKGQSLSLNIIIIAILVVLVLVVVVTFFLGGFSKVKDTITSVFFPIAAGTDYTIAIQTCQQRCDQVRLLPTSARSSSAFCKSSFSIDKNANGLPDRVGDDDSNQEKQIIKYYCNKLKTDGTDNLEVPCQVEDGTQLNCA